MTAEDIQLLSRAGEVLDSDAGIEIIAAYELLPDGLVLNTPATLQVSIGQPESTALYFAVHSSGDTTEFPPTTSSILASGELEIAVEVSHFSGIDVVLIAPWRATGDGLPVSPGNEEMFSIGSTPAVLAFTQMAFNLRRGTLEVLAPFAPTATEWLLLTYPGTEVQLFPPLGGFGDGAVVLPGRLEFRDANAPPFVDFECRVESNPVFDFNGGYVATFPFEFDDGNGLVTSTFDGSVLFSGSLEVDCQTPLTSEEVPGPATLTAIVNTDELNVRSGPSVQTPTTSVLMWGDVVALIGRNADGTWVQVSLADATEGWVSTAFLVVTGNMNDLPVVDAPPSSPICYVRTEMELLDVFPIEGGFQGNVQVTVIDHEDSPFPGADVSIETQKSDGSSSVANGLTNGSGYVTFGLQTTEPGPNTLFLASVGAGGCDLNEAMSQRQLTFDAQLPLQPPSIALSCDHRIPGVESDVIVRGSNLIPGTKVSGEVSGPGVKNTGVFVQTVGPDGTFEARIAVNKFGTYQVSAGPPAMVAEMTIGAECPAFE